MVGFCLQGGEVCIQGVCLQGVGQTPRTRKAGGTHPTGMLSLFVTKLIEFSENHSEKTQLPQLD